MQNQKMPKFGWQLLHAKFFAYLDGLYSAFANFDLTIRAEVLAFDIFNWHEVVF